MTTGTQPRLKDRFERLLVVPALALLLVALGALLTSGAPAQSLQQRLDETQSKLDQAKSKEGVLTERISRESADLERLRGEVAELRNREATVAAKLKRKQAELERAQRRLEVLKQRLRRSIEVLEARLVQIYKSGEPDFLTVVLKADGFDDLVQRADYLSALKNQDSTIVERVRDLRNEMQETVTQVKAARDEIASRKQELENTRVQLEARTAELDAARAAHQATLGEVRGQRQELEGDLTEISKQIAEQLGSGSPLPAGPVRQGSGSMIWPVNGPVSSGFGMRWGRMHEGIDIAVPSGTPIRAAQSGNIVLAGYTGGYGNYTCIDHGGGLSSCYAHQSSYARTSGSVGQGTVIGYVGCTGHCYGDHLHFEVRINGAAVDPLGYL